MVVDCGNAKAIVRKDDTHKVMCRNSMEDVKYMQKKRHISQTRLKTEELSKLNDLN